MNKCANRGCSKKYSEKEVFMKMICSKRGFRKGRFLNDGGDTQLIFWESMAKRKYL